MNSVVGIPSTAPVSCQSAGLKSGRGYSVSTSPLRAGSAFVRNDADAYKRSGGLMVNLGIILAVDLYVGELSPLPGCRRDGKAMNQILRSEDRFDELLIIEGDTNSRSVKRRLIEFLERFKNQEVDEIVFYFSGHGEYSNDEFYYLLTDYQRTHQKSTSLENSELDDLFRSLKPELVVKIVDACHSGINYIKSASEFRGYLGEGQARFKKLYFMYSSRADQSSYQNDNLSDFTWSIIKSITSTTSGNIRYKDVIDFVSDEFTTFGYQTPFFVTQADFTDVFCEATQHLKDSLKGLSGRWSAYRAQRPCRDQTRVYRGPNQGRCGDVLLRRGGVESH
jgi:hypothetical protein